MLTITKYDVSYVPYSETVDQDSVSVHDTLFYEGLIPRDVQYVAVFQDEDVLFGISN